MEKIKNKNNELKLSDSMNLIIKGNNTNKKALIPLFILSLLSILIPLVVLIYLMRSSEGLPFGFVVSCVVFVLVFGYLMRLYLWNKYGREVYIIGKEEFILYYDYGYFKDNKFHCRYKTINVLIDYNGRLRKVTRKLLETIENTKFIYITFFVDDKIVKSKNPVNMKTIWEIIQYLDRNSNRV